MILVGDIYSSALWDRNVAAWVTPVPRVTGTRETLGGIDMRVTWWRPGWGERHPGIMLVNGATALGNDDPETVRLAEALARAGYLVMLPEFPFIQEGRLEPRAPEIIDAAFGRALSLPDTAGMPVGAFGFSVGGGWYSRMMRSSMIEILRQDYIRTARAKGMSEKRVMFVHALRNAILPVIAMIGLDIGIFMSGVVVVENVFGWPGIGQLMWQAIQSLDIPIIMGVTTVAALFIVAGNFLADLTVPLIDPRIRLR